MGTNPDFVHVTIGFADGLKLDRSSGGHHHNPVVGKKFEAGGRTFYAIPGARSLDFRNDPSATCRSQILQIEKIT